MCDILINRVPRPGDGLDFNPGQTRVSSVSILVNFEKIVKNIFRLKSPKTKIKNVQPQPQN